MCLYDSFLPLGSLGEGPQPPTLRPPRRHYILPYALPRDMALRYQQINAQYGTYLLLGLVVLSFAGIPVFEKIWQIGEFMVRLVLIA